MDDLTQREFVAELEELIEQLFAATADLRRQQISGPPQRELLARTFRCLHSIKGVASAAGFIAVAELAHQAETVLERARTSRIEISNAFVDTLEDVANTIAENVADVTARRTERATDLLGQRLSALASGATGGAASRPVALPQDLSDSLNEREKQMVVAALGQGQRLGLLAVDFDVATFDTEFQRLRTTMATHCEVICTLPGSPVSDRVGFRLYFTSEIELSAVQTQIFPVAPRAIVTDVSQDLRGVKDVAPPGRANVIRVELAELDRLRSAAHEVCEQIVGALDLVSTSLTGDARTELSNLEAQVRQSLGVLEEKIFRLRAVSVNRVIERALRAGRVAAGIAGKEVEFSVSGGDLRIDKVSCDTIATPLIHLVRNAVDHGIESPEERTSAGKNRTGIVRIEASVNGGEARVVVADDGRGIDPGTISLAAAQRGLIDKDLLLDLDQSLQMIFRPGFSTAAEVSNLSGRGVGLDVVEHSLKEIGGSVSVQSHPGKGSEFELRLPQQLAKS